MFSVTWSFYKKLFTRTLALVLAVTFVAPSIFYSIPPKKAEAATTACASTFIGALTGTIAKQSASVGIEIPSGKPTAIAADATKTAALNAQYIKECIEGPIAMALAKAILDKMTNDLVAWINGGFQGKPAFVGDPGKFLLNIGDQLVGDIILGSDLAFLCSPFKVQIQLALALNYNAGSSYSDQAACTLSDVFNNVDNAFNDFSEGGWAGWFEITQNSNNNPYGSMLNAFGYMGVSINGKNSIELQKLDWGSGFMSFETCTRYDNGKTYTKVGGNGKASVVTDDEGNTYNVNNDPNGLQSHYSTSAESCQIQTPGQTIASALDNNLVNDNLRLAIADDLDQIFAALAGQLMKQVFGGIGGLLGASDTANDIEFNSSALADEIRAQAESDRDNGVNAGNSTPSNDTTGLPSSQPGVAAQNVAVGKTVYASSIAQDGDGNSYDPENLVDGSTKSSDGNGGFLGAMTNRENNPWVKIDLETTVAGISKIVINQRTNPSDDSLAGNRLEFIVNIYDKNNNGVWTSSPVSYRQDFGNPITVSVKNAAGGPVDGQYIEIKGINRSRVELTEIQVFQNQTPTISLVGGATASFTKGSSYTEPGYTAYDNQDGDVTSKVTSTNNINSNVEGSYSVTYTVTDSEGGIGTATRTVIVQPTYSTQ